MGIRAKVRRSTPRRGTVAVASRVSRPGRTTRAERPARSNRHAKSAHVNGSKAHKGQHKDNLKEANGVHAASNGIASYSKALRFLATLADFEKLRIVRYNSQNFDLDRMRTLLKKLGNPQDQFRSV